MSERHCRMMAAAIAIGVTFSSATLRANDSDTYRAALIRAVEAKERAVESNREDDWLLTLTRFREAEEIQETAGAVYEIGLAASRLSFDDLAVESYVHAIELGLQGTAREKAERYLAKWSKAMVHLFVRGPEGAQVSINGVSRARLPLSKALIVRRGHLVMLVAPPDAQSEPIRKEFEVSTDSADPYVVDLEQPTLAASPPRRLATQPEPEHSSHHADAEQTVQKGASSYTQIDTSSSLHRPGWALFSSGVTLGVMSAVFIPVCNSRLAENRQVLQDNCAIAGNGADSCRFAAPGHQAIGQSASDSIATWKMARTVSWLGLASGITATVVGITVLWTHPKRSTIPRVQVSSVPSETQLTLLGEF